MHDRRRIVQKVTEIPALTTPASASASASGSSASASYLSFYNKSTGPGTDAPKKASLLGVEKELETPLSPGFGELASLLQEAAWLEFSLEKGELPDDVKKEESGVQEEEQEGKEKESQKDKEAAARAKVEEERKKHAAVAKARAKQEEKESKSNSGPGAFRNTLLRTKSGHKREESTDSQLRKEPVRSKSLPFRPLPTPPSQPSTPSKTTTSVSTPKKEVAPSISSSIDREDKNSNSTLSLSSQTSPKSPTRTSLPRDSVSASSEDSSGIPTPPGNGGDASAEGRNGLFGWPSLSPKRSPGVGRSASFTDKIFNRGKKTSSASNEGDAASAYEAIDRLGKSKAGKSATSLIPPLDTPSFSLDVPVIHENDQPLPSPQELVSPRRSASLYVPATSQFPPVYSARPTSSVYTSIPLLSENGSKPSRTLASVDEDQLASPPFATDPSIQPHGIDAALFSAKPTSPVYTPHFSQIPKEMQSDTPVTSKTPHRPHDAGLFSVKPTSPVYTPHTSAFAMRSEDTITDSPLLRPNPDGDRPDSWMSETSRDSSAIPASACAP
ncbi:hypothetical protein H0H93_003214 [Arthromyces matolae]|nr:hypothetical protein H0H93_003214 [Arthromyces matolae]